MDTSQHQSWKSHPKKRGYARAARDLRRLSIVVALVALSAVLIYFLFPPFFAPQTHLVLIGSKGGASFNTPAIGFVAEDLAAMQTIEEATVRDRSDVLRTAQNARRLSEELSDDKISASDQLIVYVTAHGMTEGGKAYLLCDNFDLRQQDSGRLSVDRLIAQVRQSPAATKLIVINAGSIDYDPRMGVIGNDFSRLLRSSVRESNDPTLWVYCSHAAMQHSHLSQAANRSVFGMFFGEGLKGAADIDGNRVISLSELVGFTSANVSNWVSQSTDGGAKQTPRLMWGGNGSDSPNPQLLTLHGDPSTGALTVASLIGDQDAGKAGTGSIRAGRVQGLIRRQVSLTSTGVSSPKDSAKNPAQEKGKPAEGSSESSESQGATADPTASNESGSSNDSKDGSPDAPSPKENSENSARLLADVWDQRDQLDGQWTAFDPTRDPVENQPHLWREFQAELLGYEQRIRGGKGFDLDAIDEILKESIPSETANADPKSKSPPKSPLRSLFDQKKGTVKSSAALNRMRQYGSLAMLQAAADLDGRPSEIDLDRLQVAVDAPTRKLLVEWFAQNWRPDYQAYIDLDFIHRISETESLDWPLSQLAAQTSLQGERVAALDRLSPGWVRDQVERGDQYRFFAEQLIFNQVGLQWRQRLVEMLGKAGQAYESAEQRFLEIRRCEKCFDEVVARFPSYLRWNRGVRFVPDARLSITHELESMLTLMSELSTTLDPSGNASTEHLAGLRSEIELINLASNLRAEVRPLRV